MYAELGDALIAPLSEHLSRLSPGLACREAAAFLRLIQAGEMDVPPPPELVEALTHLRLPQPAIEKVPAYLFRAIWKECAQRLYQRQAVTPWLREEVIPVVEWFVLAGQDAHTDSNKRRARWVSYVSDHDEWSNKRAEPNGTRSWQALMPRFETGPFVVQELTHETALYAEGAAMHHCVADWVGECLLEDVHVFSIRARRDGSRLATMAVSISNRGVWHIIQLKGPHNAPVSKLIDELAAIFEGWLNEFGPRQHPPQACRMEIPMHLAV